MKEKKLESPYLNSKSAWNSVFGKSYEQLNFYKKLSFLSSIVSIISVIGVIFFATQTKYIPFVLEVNKDYAPLQVHQLEKLGKRNTAVTRSLLGTFFKSYRVVYKEDKNAQTDAMNNVYYFLKKNTQAYNYVTETYKKENPFNIKNSIKIDIKNILPLSDSGWRIEWTETNMNFDGSESLPIKFSAIVSVDYDRVIAAENILINPIGMYITSVQISKEF